MQNNYFKCLGKSETNRVNVYTIEVSSGIVLSNQIYIPLSQIVFTSD